LRGDNSDRVVEGALREVRGMPGEKTILPTWEKVILPFKGEDNKITT
jgi:hypothetical protein